MTRLLGVAAGGSLLAGPALVTSQFALRHANALPQQAKADLAAPDTPLGRAQADAVRASTEGPQDGSAYRAWRRRSSSRAVYI